MPVNSPGKPKRLPARRKMKSNNTTTEPTKRQHRFQSFSDRIAALSINPVTRARGRGDLDVNATNVTASHFRQSLDQWRDMNLSEHFTKFVRTVDPLCDSLPQILHHETTLVDVLLQHIGAGSPLSLEPLLSLLSALAHDLGARFERHFARSLAVVCEIISASRQDVEVLEWSFATLAWVFKYLSRLLVPDLRPTLDIMAPLLGNTKHKAYISRFAAEALSFLVRRAALMHHQDHEPLQRLIKHAFGVAEEKAGGDDSGIYEYGLMNLFAESIKGVKRELHSRGEIVFKALLCCCSGPAARRIVAGIFINILHESTPAASEQLFQYIQELASGSQQPEAPQFLLVADLVFHAATLRDGSRVARWASLMTAITSYHVSQFSSEESTILAYGKAYTALVAKAPLAESLLQARNVVDLFLRPQYASTSTSLLEFCHRLNPARFLAMFRRDLRRYIDARYLTRGDETLLLLVKIAATSGGLEDKSQPKNTLIPSEWLSSIIKGVQNEQSELSEHQLYRQNACLEISLFMPIDALLDDLSRRLTHLLSNNADSVDARFLLGRGLEAILASSYAKNFADFTNLLDISSTWNVPICLDNFRRILKLKKLNINDSRCILLTERLVRNLQSPSKRLRISSLSLLQQLDASSEGNSLVFFETALAVERVPVDHEAVRKISLHTTQLTQQYQLKTDQSIIQRAFPHFMLGLLTYQLTEIWPVAIEGLKAACEKKEGEELVSSLVFDWLHSVPVNVEDKESQSKSDRQGRTIANEFQCIKSEAAKEMFDEIRDALSEPEKALKDLFHESHRQESLTNSNACLQALRILKSIAWLAEKKSRLLVPLFLSWVLPGFGDGDDSSLKARSSRPERLLALDIFAAFHNPRVLYHSDKVYKALLEMLKSPELEFQKRALKALMTWKQTNVVELDSVFAMILDEARFRDGILELSRATSGTALTPQFQEEVMPILLRLLFGRMTASSKYSNTSTQKSKRNAVFDVLAHYPNEHLKTFLGIAVGSASPDLDGTSALASEIASDLSGSNSRRKLGLLNFIKDMISFYGDRLVFLTQQVADVVLLCAATTGEEPVKKTETPSNLAQQEIQQNADTDGQSDEPEDDDPNEGNGPVLGQSSVAVRRLSLKCLNLMFEKFPPTALSNLVPQVYQVFIVDRLNNLAEESTQSISNLFRLLATWSSKVEMHTYLLHAEKLLFRCVDVLLTSSVKEDTQSFVIEEILFPFFSTGDAKPTSLILYTLQCCHELLQTEPSKSLQALLIALVTCLASQASGSTETISLLKISCDLLEQPPARVSPKTKSDILGIVQQLCSELDTAKQSELFKRTFQIIASLFNYFKDRDNRLKLCQILALLSEKDPELELASHYCSDLNSFSSKLVDEPDFDRRREAYERLVGPEMDALSRNQWTPIIYNLLYFLQETDELGVGSNACFALCAFIKHAKYNPGLLDLVTSKLMPAMHKGAHESSEEVRREYLKVMSTMAHELPGLDEVKDMTVLLMDDDEEANIFNNLLHIQHHRRIRALHRLASPQVCTHLSSSNTAYFLIPLIEHFVLGRQDDNKAGTLASETIVTIGALTSALQWVQARGLYMRYLHLMRTKLEVEKTTIKLLGCLVDALAKAFKERAVADGTWQDVQNGNNEISTADSVHDADTQETSTLSKSMPDSAKLEKDVLQNLLPPLTAFLRHKDEAVVSLRIPMALSAVKLMTLLPRQSFASRLPPVLTDVCHVLRSRTAESRDLCRKSLAAITKVIGPSYFGFVLKELRNSLQRGYQLHVMSYTMHTLLVETSVDYTVGSLDHCMYDAVAIIMDDIFGVVGQEKDAEGYISKMKEVKQSKSQDSMELLAKLVSIQRLGVLVRPIQALLQEKLDFKTVKKVDDLLRRISAGLLKNSTIEDRQSLVFCYELIQKAYASSDTPVARGKDAQMKRFIVNLRGSRANETQSGTLFGFKIVRFALELLRSLVSRFDVLRNQSNLEGFMPILGDAIVQGEDEVQMAAFRLLSAIMKVPLRALDTEGPAYVSAAVNVLRNTASNDSDMAQAALKLISAILRDKPDLKVTDDDVAYLIKRLRPDLERYDNHGIVFNFLKSVVGQGYLLPEVYEIMDAVSAMMITSQSREAQSMARALYFQFIVKYPHDPKRLEKQIAFLGKNLEYPQVDGRKSVLEAIHRLLGRGGSLAQEIIRFLFEPLTFALIMDDNSDCRKMAGLLLGECFDRAEGEQHSRISKLTRDWLMLDSTASDKNWLQVRGAFQLYAIRAEKEAEKIESMLPTLCQRVKDTIENSTGVNSNEEWALLYYALRLLNRLTKEFPDRLLHSQFANLWSMTQSCASYPHTWIKHAVAELLGEYLSQFVGKNRRDFPLPGRNGLVLELGDVFDLTNRSLRTLQTPSLTMDLADLTVQNLAIIASLSQYQDALPLDSIEHADSEQEDDDDINGSQDSESERLTWSVIQTIFQRLSWMVRKKLASSQASALVPRTAALKLYQALSAELEAEVLRPLLATILQPLHHLTDAAVTVPFSTDEGFKNTWKDNVSIAHDIVDTLQRRLGSAAYIKEMSAVQAAARTRREERRTKRRIEAVAAPDKALREKRRKHERTKERRKEKIGMYRARRQGY